MSKQILQPMIGISGIVDAPLCHKITSYATPSAQRPFCVTANLTVNTIERGVPCIDNVRYARRKSLTGMFEVSTPNVVHLVRCLRESPTEHHPSAGMLSRAMNIGGKNCHGIRLSLDDATTSALVKFRTHYPNAIVALDITSSAFRNRCGGNHTTLLELLSGYAEEYAEPLVNYVFIEIDERKSTNSFPIKQGFELLNLLMKYNGESYGIGISGSINEESLDMLRRNVRDWEQVSIDGGETLREANTALLTPERVHEFLAYAFEMFKSDNN